MDEHDFIGILYRLDAHWRYERLCRVLSTQKRLMVFKLRTRDALQSYFPGAQAHSQGLHWTYHRSIDCYRLGIVFRIPLEMTPTGAATTFMLVLRRDTYQISAVPMRDIYHRVGATRHSHKPLYPQVFNQSDLEEMLLFARVLYDDVYAAIVQTLQ